MSETSLLNYTFLFFFFSHFTHLVPNHQSCLVLKGICIVLLSYLLMNTFYLIDLSNVTFSAYAVSWSVPVVIFYLYYKYMAIFLFLLWLLSFVIPYIVFAIFVYFILHVSNLIIIWITVSLSNSWENTNTTKKQIRNEY